MVKYLITGLLCLVGCAPASFFSLTSAFSGVAGRAEVAERVTNKERNEIVDMAVARIENQTPKSAPVAIEASGPEWNSKEATEVLRSMTQDKYSEKNLCPKPVKILGINHYGQGG